jgi:hypothetical protein
MVIPVWTRETLTYAAAKTSEKMYILPPYTRAKRQHERRAARVRTRRRRMGIPAWTRETLTWRWLPSPLTTVSVSS